MGKTTELAPDNHYQIHKARIVEAKSKPNSLYIEDVEHINEHELEDYDGISVEDVSDDENIDTFEAFDSGCRLVKTNSGEFLIVHHNVVPTGAWSNINDS